MNDESNFELGKIAFLEGVNYLDKENYEEAENCFVKSLSYIPDRASSLINLSIAQLKLKKLDLALANAEKAIAQSPNNPLYVCQLGNVLIVLNRYNEALDYIQKAIAIDPRFSEAYVSHGNALRELDRLEEALESYDQAIALNPNYAEAYCNRGLTLKALKRFDDAFSDYDHAIALEADHAEAFNNRGCAFIEIGQYENAIRDLTRAIQIRPSYIDALINLGNAYSHNLQFEDAITSYDKVLLIQENYDPAIYSKGILLLQQKQFAEGFECYSARKRVDKLEFKFETTIPDWDGSPVDGNLLLSCEQGIGDEIFYSSMLSLLKMKNTHVYLAADQRLIPIFERSFPDVKVFDRKLQNKTISEKFRAHASTSDLGKLLFVNEARIADRQYPFLKIDQKRRESLLSRHNFLSAAPVCGISWRSINKKFGDLKSIALEEMLSPFRDQDITFVNLQYGEVADEIAELKSRYGIHVYSASDVDNYNDIEGLLALIDCCDCVLTTSNSTAHLAGAIGKKGLVMIPSSRGRFWYWHEDKTSLWYPSLDLVFQDRQNGWQSAINFATNWVRRTLT